MPDEAAPIAALVAHAKGQQEMSYDPNAALGKKLRTHGYVTALSDEDYLTLEGQQWAVQLGVNWQSGQEAVAIARVNQWGQEQIGVYRLDGTPVYPLPGVAGKPLITVDVPFVSQIGTGADWLDSDCGAACVAMVVWQQTGVQESVNGIAHRLESLGYEPNYARITALVAGLEAYGVEATFIHHTTWEDVRANLEAGKPVIALTNYEHLPYRPFNYQGGHYVILCEMKEREGKEIVVYMDPFRPVGDGYAGKGWAHLDTFWRAWSDGGSYWRTPRQAVVLR